MSREQCQGNHPMKLYDAAIKLSDAAMCDQRVPRCRSNKHCDSWLQSSTELHVTRVFDKHSELTGKDKWMKAQATVSFNSLSTLTEQTLRGNGGHLSGAANETAKNSSVTEIIFLKFWCDLCNAYMFSLINRRHKGYCSRTPDKSFHCLTEAVSYAGFTADE